jgi:hypothetical protein
MPLLLQANQVRSAMRSLLAWRQSLPCATACIGMILFVAGWSLMWGAALQLFPFVPIAPCPCLMIAGLVALKYSFARPIEATRLSNAPEDGRRVRAAGRGFIQ